MAWILSRLRLRPCDVGAAHVLKRRQEEAREKAVDPSIADWVFDGIADQVEALPVLRYCCRALAVSAGGDVVDRHFAVTPLRGKPVCGPCSPKRVRKRVGVTAACVLCRGGSL